MVELLTSYAIKDILIILAIAAGIFIGAWRAWIFVKNQLEEKFKPDDTKDRLSALEELGKDHHDSIKLLIDSDKSRIKGEILDKYKYFMAKGSIDVYSLEYLHQQYSIYQAEGGNSFVKELMDDLDDLDISSGIV